MLHGATWLKKNWVK
uniref:Uncharacterized protein n=1 Tax=Rhizophora mucronata TaxID=61149 RepID=A0A2P2N9E8_RHIMU